ncbi:T9SS type A sorting domain-containing protein [Lacinutrix sp. WUR7]|uniref:T9SS type A sorting domain-containing protein n=1 Tax=Lacinutrix sp. WUR7 TaxID=2653681 RepID=UPI00193D5400|nr:T9SS type A sorting domain-containing protein [Lacinutrix sp. WUR7]QRM88679.1 T9SS type A sorting domain-containing protein [Lacinutrix sp. WUR7]
MKKIYTLLLSIICMYQVHAQYTAIPDPAFEQILINNSTDSEGTLDGQVLTSDLTMVNSLNISNSNISDLTGIQDFIALTSLEARNASIINLDVSGLVNLRELILAFTYTLETLNVNGCTGLVNLDIKITGLNILDLSTCTSLETIDMYKSTLRHLDVHGVTSLTYIRANESYLSTLNVTGCTSLSSINISETGMRSLDLSNNPSIVNFGCFDCFLEDLNLSNCINFETLDFWRVRDITNINLTNCNNFTGITTYESSLHLQSLDLTGVVDLETFHLDEVTISELDLSNNLNLHEVTLGFCTIGSLNLKNGNNTNFTNFGVHNSNLSCITVDNADYSTLNWTSISNSSVLFSNDCQTLSNNENQINNISIYPNPVVNNLNIGLQSHQILENVIIVDLQGKQMLTTTETAIDLSHLSSGYYFALINTNQGRSIKKILKK